MLYPRHTHTSSEPRGELNPLRAVRHMRDALLQKKRVQHVQQFEFGLSDTFVLRLKTRNSIIHAK